MFEIDAQQNELHRKLNTYVNGSVFSRQDLILSCPSPLFPLIKNSRWISSEYAAMKRKLPQNRAHAVEINIQRYEGKNIYVHQMQRFLIQNLVEDLFGAYVHGSLGVYEEIPYSDFDALVIIRDEVMMDSRRLWRTVYKLNKARSIMYEFDPLQHHGWFVLTENDLRHFPEHYYPLDVLRNSKSMLNDQGMRLEISLRRDEAESKLAFYEMVDSIIAKIESNQIPKNLYQLKTLLSQFMLLPALYILARDNKGVFKKVSFDKLRGEFPADDWSAMDDVSKIRKIWHIKFKPFTKWLFSRSFLIVRILRKKYSLKIPSEINAFLSDELYMKMNRLAHRMKMKLEEYANGCDQKNAT